MQYCDIKNILKSTNSYVDENVDSCQSTGAHELNDVTVFWNGHIQVYPIG